MPINADVNVPETARYFWAAFSVLWIVIIGYSVFLVQRKVQFRRTLAMMKEHLKESQKR